MRPSLLFVIAALALPLGGCLVAGDLAYLVTERPSQATLNRMAGMCRADAGLRVFGPPPKGVDLWIPGRLQREPTEGDDLHGVTPTDSWWNTDEPWLRLGYARAVYENIEPNTVSPAVYLGPKRGDPAGLYKFELAPPDDPRCVAFRKVQADWLRGSPPPPTTDQRCVVWSRVGPFDFRPHPNTFIRFEDEALLQASGIWRSGEVLFVDGRRRAQSLRYQARQVGEGYHELGTWQTSACEKTSGQLPDDFERAPPPSH